jgi:hypothetical protein
MSEARKEILRLIAEGKITPEEGDRLLRALEESAGESDREPGESTAKDSSRGGRFADGFSQMVEEIGETVRRAVEDAVGSAQKVLDEHRSTTESVAVIQGGFAIPDGGRLRVQQALRLSFGGGSKGGNVILRTASGGEVRVVRGEAIEAHKNGTDYVLTWAKGNLELEIPRVLAGLDVRCMGGDMEVIDFIGPMTLDTMGGELRVQSPRAPFRFRTLGGRVRIVDCDLRDGSSVISSAGGDVHVELARPRPSRSAYRPWRRDRRASRLQTEEQPIARRRATCVIGATADLKIDAGRRRADRRF